MLSVKITDPSPEISLIASMTSPKVMLDRPWVLWSSGAERRRKGEEMIEKRILGKNERGWRIVREGHMVVSQ